MKYTVINDEGKEQELLFKFTPKALMNYEAAFGSNFYSDLSKLGSAKKGEMPDLTTLMKVSSVCYANEEGKQNGDTLEWYLEQEFAAALGMDEDFIKCFTDLITSNKFGQKSKKK